MTDSNGTAYKTTKVAEILQVSTSTIRKYAAIIEKKHVFMKDDRQERLFTESDITALRHMRQLITGGKTMDEAGAITATLLMNEVKTRAESGEVMAQNDRTLFKEMANQIETLTKQNEAMATVISEMNKKQSHIMAALSRIETSRKDEAAESIEVEVTNEEVAEKPRGFFAKLFSR